MGCTIAGTLALWMLGMLVPAVRAEEFALPPNDGFITDPGDVIPLVEEEELEERMLAERRQAGLEFVSVILPSLGGRDIAHLAWELRTRWGLQQNGSGVLLLIAREEGKVLIAPGAGHEQIFTDGALQEIIETDVLPALRRGEYARAIGQGTDALHQRLRDGRVEKPPRSGLPIQGVRSPIVVFLLMLLLGCTWAQRRKRGGGQTRRGHR